MIANTYVLRKPIVISNAELRAICDSPIDLIAREQARIVREIRAREDRRFLYGLERDALEQQIRADLQADLTVDITDPGVLVDAMLGRTGGVWDYKRLVELWRTRIVRVVAKPSRATWTIQAWFGCEDVAARLYGAESYDGLAEAHGT